MFCAGNCKWQKALVHNILLLQNGGVYMPKKLIKKKETISKEETLYRSAVSLMEAVDCISKFDRLVSSLNDAAKKFQKLGSYKDSRQRMEKCFSDAKEAADSGAMETFNTAVQKFKIAKNKSDFADIIEDLKLVKKFGYKEEDCNKNIQYCHRRIKKLETIAMCKRYINVLCILMIFTIAFINTPFFPLVKGMYYQSKGELNVALNYYIESGGVLHGASKIKECYYGLAEDFMKEGSYEKALTNYKFAKNKSDAEEKAFELEKKFIGEAYPRDIVKYGDSEWILLNKIDNYALLFGKNILKKKMQFDKKGSNTWQDSSLCRWLNTKYIKRFSKHEKSAMMKHSQLKVRGKKYKERVSILSRAEYEQYRGIIANNSEAYWLKDRGMVEGNVCYVADDVNTDGIAPVKDNIGVRCSLWMKYK